MSGKGRRIDWSTDIWLLVVFSHQCSHSDQPIQLLHVTISFDVYHVPPLSLYFSYQNQETRTEIMTTGATEQDKQPILVLGENPGLICERGPNGSFLG